MIRTCVDQVDKIFSKERNKHRKQDGGGGGERERVCTLEIIIVYRASIQIPIYRDNLKEVYFYIAITSR